MCVYVAVTQALCVYLCVCEQTDMPGGGVTAGLTTGQTLTRIIVRDPVGKFCWDNSVLYGPPKCRAGSYPAGGSCVHRGRSLSLTHKACTVKKLCVLGELVSCA